MEHALKINGKYESIEFTSSVILTEGLDTITILGKINNNSFANIKNISKNNTITNLDNPFLVNYKLISKEPFDYSISMFPIPLYYNKSKIEDYLYEITYANLDYEYAKQYMTFPLGACSSIRNGNWFGRNFDWKYNHQVQLIVHTPTTKNSYSTLGVSGIIPNVNKDSIDLEFINIEGIEMFKLIPFYLLDGINEKGVFCTHNIVPLDDINNPTLEIIAKKLELDKIPIPMLVRYILDNFKTAQAAIDYIINYVTLYFPEEMLQANYLSHFMIGDCNHTYIIEFINNEIKIINFNYITNFQINGVTFGEDNTILYPPTQFGINAFGTGLERWDLISNAYSTTNTKLGMQNMLSNIKFSNCYDEEDFWYSETVGLEDDEGNILTVDTSKELCTTAKRKFRMRWQHKNRDTEEVWITCHSSIYDIKNKKLFITNLENQTEYLFTL